MVEVWWTEVFLGAGAKGQIGLEAPGDVEGLSTGLSTGGA